MKKLLAIAIVLMMVPFTAFAMETISDSDMDNVTGQAGVSISLDNVKIYQSIDGISYTDTDGIAGAASAGTIAITNITQVITLDAIADGTEYTNAAGDVVATCATSRPLTIDVTALDSASATKMGGPAAIVIGLPTLEINVSEFSFDIELSNAAGTTASFGTIKVGAQKVAILSGTIVIAAH